MVFHGFRSLFGEDCVDYNPAWYMYDDMRKYWNQRVPENGMSYGRGFTLYGRLPKLNINRSDIESKIKNHYFDKIVYGSITRCSSFFMIATKSYKQNEIVLIDGEDDQIVNTALAQLGTYYKRELAEKNLGFFGIKPINFCIPKELIVSSIPKKEKDYASIIPGNSSTYIYTEEEPYYEDYKKSYFGLTSKKGGWDCLRHYEILMNGCIPFFTDLELCPPTIMQRFPKQLVLSAMNKIKKEDDLSFYNSQVETLLGITRQHLTTESVVKDLL